MLKASTLHAGLRKVFSGDEWLRVLGLLVPVVAYVVALKVVRILTQVNVPGPAGFLDQVRSDVLANVGFAVFWLGVTAVVRRRWTRWITVFVMHVTALAVVVWATLAHLFYVKTGSPLDLAMMSFAWRTRDDINGLVAAELSPWYAVWLALLVGHAAGSRWLVDRLIRSRARARPDPGRSAERPRWLLLVAAALSTSLVLLAAAPSRAAAGFSADSMLNLVMGPLETRKFAHPADVVVPTAEQLPTRTSLGQTAQTNRRNVVMIFLESVRAQSTSLDNDELSTTPYLAQLARTSLVAENAYTVVPHTSKALAAAHCGVAPPLDMRVTESTPRGIYARCLPELLGRQGYRSAFFQSAVEDYDDRPDLVAHLGYDDFFPVDDLPKEGFAQANYFGWEDDIMLEPSRDWLQQKTGQPFLASYLTVTSHHDYNVPAGFATQTLSDDPELNSYLNTIRYQDRFVKRLIQQYKRLGLYDNTVFVIMADHGEGFGEHDRRQHDNTVYDEGVKIPLLIHDPLDPRPRRLEAPVQPTAVLATVADLLGYRIEGGRYAASSMLAPSAEPVRIACYGDDRCLASIRGTEKYIFHFGQRPDEYFDLATDPGETNNLLAQQDRHKIAELREDLLRWRAEVRSMTTVGRGSDMTEGAAITHGR